MKTKIKYMIIVAILFAMIGSVSAGSFYVSTNGNDGNAGTSMSNAFETVEHGSSQLKAGDTLYIDGGTYHNDKVSIKNSGIPNNWIKVTNYNNEDVLLQHDKSFNSDSGISGLCHKSYVEISGLDFSHYGTIAYISGKYEGNTHHIVLEDMEVDRTYSRAFCCNAGAHDMRFENINIGNVEHPSSSPNAFDFLTSPHDYNYNPHSDYMIYNIEVINVDIGRVDDHNGFNFGQGTSTNDGEWDSHWDTQLCDNFHFDGCNVYDAAGAGYYTNKYVLYNSIIENCEVKECINGLGLIGNNLLIKNVHSHDNKFNDMFFLWDAKSYDVIIECFTGDKPGLSNKNGFTIIECGTPREIIEEEDEVEEEIEEDENAWLEEYIGEDSDGGSDITTVELQDASYHWSEDIPVRGHLLTTEDLQLVIALWQES